MARTLSGYCLYQLVGWSGVFLFVVVANVTLMGIPVRLYWILLIFVTLGIGVLISHLLRTLILRTGWIGLPLRKTLRKLVPALLLAILAASVLRSFLPVQYPSHLPFFKKLTVAACMYATLFTPWLLIYCLCHFIDRDHRKRMEHRRLDLLLRERRQDAVRSSVDLATLTDNLDQLTGQIDQDPAKARASITAFSRLLRTSYWKTE